MVLPSTEVRLTGLPGLFPGSSFFPFLKMGFKFVLFHSLRTSPECHSFTRLPQLLKYEG